MKQKCFVRLSRSHGWRELGAVELKPLRALRRRVSLEEIKADKNLASWLWCAVRGLSVARDRRRISGNPGAI